MTCWAEVQKGGRVTIPASLRKECGLSEGDVVSISLIDDEIRINSWRKNMDRVREMVNRRIPQNVSLVDEFIKERRTEAAREATGDQVHQPGLAAE